MMWVGGRGGGVDGSEVAVKMTECKSHMGHTETSDSKV